jgi:hypothetical protein
MSCAPSRPCPGMALNPANSDPLTLGVAGKYTPRPDRLCFAATH